jgi:hypothetical protein
MSADDVMADRYVCSVGKCQLIRQNPIMQGLEVRVPCDQME